MSDHFGNVLLTVDNNAEIYFNGRMVGTGRYVTITTSVPRSELTIDGEFAGQAPIYNRYMNYGRHKVQAVNDRYEGIQEFVILVLLTCVI